MTLKSTLAALSLLSLAACSANPTRKNAENRIPASAGVASSVDDQCAVAYSQEAGRCNTRFRHNEKRFNACLADDREALKDCCDAEGATDHCVDGAL